MTTFKAVENPFNKNQTIIYENDNSLRFAIEKANFTDDNEYYQFIEKLVNALNATTIKK